MPLRITTESCGGTGREQAEEAFGTPYYRVRFVRRGGAMAEASFNSYPFWDPADGSKQAHVATVLTLWQYVRGCNLVLT